MLRGIENLFYRDPRLLALTIAVIVVAGLSAYMVLPRAEDPTLVERYASITTYYPGASAERVEALVTEKIEDELREVEEIKLLESVSRLGMSFITVELHDAIDDVDPVWSRVRDKVGEAEARLPREASKPEVERMTVTAYTLLIALTWELDEPVQYAILRRVAEELEDAMRALGGTDDVELFGDPEEEYRVEIDAGRMATLGLNAADVASALAQSDAKAPAGELQQADNDLLIEVAGELSSLDRLLEVPVVVRPDGQAVRVADLATVRKTVADPPSEIALIDGQRGIVVAVRMKNEQRVDRWAEDARAALATFAESAPPGLGVELLFDQSKYVEARLNGLTQNLLLAMGLVVVVIFFMMGLRSALAVGAALPLASLMVLAGLRLLDVPLQQMSVTGLIVALGLLIDNAIVIVDEVRRRTAAGLAAVDAIAKAVRHLAIPLAGSTFTTALAFMPLVLMPGGAGEFVGSIAISVILAIVSSLFLSLTVIPALAGRLQRLVPEDEHQRAGARFLSDGVHSAALTQAYRGLLEFLYRRPALGVLVAVVLPVIGFWQAQGLAEQFFPPAERTQFAIELELPPHAALGQTERLAEAARAALADDPQVVRSHWFLGTSAPKFYYNMLETREDSAFFAHALVQIRDAQQVERTIRRLQRTLDAALPAAQAVVRQLEQGPPFDAPVELRVFGPDLDELYRIGEDIRGRLAALPHVTHTRATLQDAAPKLWVTLDEAQARSVGLDNTGVAAQIRANVSGITGGSVLEGTEELPVRVRLAPDARRDVAELSSLDLRVAQQAEAAYLPLAAVGTVRLEPERAAITRYQGVRVNTVQAFTTAGTLPAESLRAIQADLAASDFQLPAGYRLEVGGEAEQRDTAIGNLFASVSVLATMMAALLVLTFSSFRLAGLLGVVAGLSMGLGVFALWLWGYPFGFMAIVGTMGLVGVAVNDSIVVLAAIRDDERARRAEPAAVCDVVVRATRHVLSTTITTIAGFLPLMLAGGQFWPPLAIAIAGGVAGATLLALVLVPSAYRILMRPRAAAVAAAGRADARAHAAAT